MNIETVEIATDAENGPQFMVTGRSLESILERRIITSGATFSGNVQSIIISMLNT